MTSVHTVEFQYYFVEDAYEKQCDEIEKKCDTRGDRSSRLRIKDFERYGLTIALCPTKAKMGGRVYIVANLGKLVYKNYKASDLLDPTDENLEYAKEQIEKHLKQAGLPCKLKQYTLSQVHPCVNFEEKTNREVRERLRLLRKGLTPSKSNRKPFHDPRRSDEDNRACNKDYLCFIFPWGSIVLYDKKKQSIREAITGCEKVPRGTLRVELQLNCKGLQRHQLESRKKGWKLVCWLAKNSEKIISDQLNQAFYKGCYMKLEELYRIIESSDFKKPVRERMIQYVYMVKRYGEVEAKQKLMKTLGWSKSEFDYFRSRFEALNIQPVPLRKNYHENFLNPLVSCLFSDRDANGFYMLKRRKESHAVHKQF